MLSISRIGYSYHTSRSLDGVASDTNGQVTREEDALGNTVDYDYGIHGQVTTVKDKNGNRLTNVYYTEDNTTTGAIADKLQRKIAAKATVNGEQYLNVVLVEYKYNSDGTPKELIEYIDPAQPQRRRVTQYTYTYEAGGAYQRKATTSGSGKQVVVKDSYDKLRRKISTTTYRRASATDATQIALTTQFDYDDLNRIIRTTDSVGNIVETIYDANGKVSKAIQRYKLLEANNSPIHPECRIDPEYPDYHTCVVEQRTNDVADRLLTSTNIDGAVTRYKYDAIGNIIQVTNDLGNSLYYDYDAMGNRTKVTDENGYTLKTRYDLSGRVVSITDANNQTIRYTYDAMGRKLTATSLDGKVTRYDEYDANGNLLRMTDANGVAGKQPLNNKKASVYSEFDEFNRLVSSLNANNEQTHFTYDLLGNKTSVIDAKGQITRLVYNDLGRLIKVVDPIIESGTDKVVSMTYDELGNRLTYTVD